MNAQANALLWPDTLVHLDETRVAVEEEAVLVAPLEVHSKDDVDLLRRFQLSALKINKALEFNL